VTAQDPLVQRIFVNAAIKKALCREAGADRAWLSTSACAARATAPNASRSRPQTEATAAARTSIIGSPTPCCTPGRRQYRRRQGRESPYRASHRRATRCWRRPIGSLRGKTGLPEHPLAARDLGDDTGNHPDQIGHRPSQQAKQRGSYLRNLILVSISFIPEPMETLPIQAYPHL
jgi:hypothetical protein